MNTEAPGGRAGQQDEYGDENDYQPGDGEVDDYYGEDDGMDVHG